MGEFPEGFMVDDFEKAIDVLEPGQRTGIFTTPFGFHIARLNGKTRAAIMSFQEVRRDIEGALSLQNQHSVYLRGIAKLRAEADIRFMPEAQ